MPASITFYSFLHLRHDSLEFDPAYDLICAGIEPPFLETREFLRNRLRVRDEGPGTEQERMLVQDGYSLHLIVARDGSRTIGAIYGHLIGRITEENRAVCFVTYIAVHPRFRRRGIGRALIQALLRAVGEDAARSAGKPLFGVVYEIEEERKEEIKAVVSGLGARPLELVYHQPALRLGYEPERMQLWFQPIPRLAPRESAFFALDRNIVHDMVRNLLAMEYVRPEMRGFDLSSRPYALFLESIRSRSTVGFAG